MVHGFFGGVFISWPELATLEFERFLVLDRGVENGKRGKSSERGEKMWTSVWLTVVELGKERKRRWWMA